MTEGPYSPLKVFHHQDRLERIKRREPTAPAHVQIFISDLCNYRCSFCIYRWHGNISNQLFAEVLPDGTVNDNPRRMIPYDKVIEILDDCVEMGVGAIQVTGGGEPFVHPQHCDIFEAILDRGLELAVVTNGSNLSERACDILTRPGCKWVRVSLDAGTADTYSEIKRVPRDSFNRTLEGIRRLVNAKSDNHEPIIGVGFVVAKENWQEVELAAAIVREIGVDNLRISAAFQPDDEKYFEGFHDKAAECCRLATKHTAGAFMVFNLFGDRIEDMTVHSPSHPFCGYQHFTTLIGASLDFYRCCNLAYNKLGYLGSIKNQRFRDAWFSEEVQGRLWGLDARSCPRCMFNNKLKTINYALNDDPEHVNFV